MQKPLHPISSLIIKHLEGVASLEEKQALDTWINDSAENQYLFEELCDEFRMNEDLTTYSGDIKATWAKILTLAPELQEATTKQINWLRFAGAVAIILLMGISFLCFTDDNYTQSHVIQSDSGQYNSSDVVPGGNKATFTLADGKQMSLDVVHNGQVAEQGTMQVVKQGDGTIEYRGSIPSMDGSNQGIVVLYNTINTNKGGQYKLQLNDGTPIWLNAASSVTYPTLFTGKKREESISGGVYIEVAPNKSNPFIEHIANNKTNIEVLGTRFTVNAYEDEPYIKTTLLEGSVKLTAQVQGENINTILRPGQQTKVSHENLEKIKEANTEEAIAFINGFFYFNQADIKTVICQSEKWYDIQVLFAQPVRNSTFDGEIQRTLALSVVLEILERNDVKFSVEGHGGQLGEVSDNKEAIAWKNGVIAFNKAPIENIIREVARNYDVEVAYDGVRPTDKFTVKKVS